MAARGVGPARVRRAFGGSARRARRRRPAPRAVRRARTRPRPLQRRTSVPHPVTASWRRRTRMATRGVGHAQVRRAFGGSARRARRRRPAPRAWATRSTGAAVPARDRNPRDHPSPPRAPLVPRNAAHAGRGPVVRAWRRIGTEPPPWTGAPLPWAGACPSGAARSGARGGASGRSLRPGPARRCRGPGPARQGRPGRARVAAHGDGASARDRHAAGAGRGLPVRGAPAPKAAWADRPGTARRRPRTWRTARPPRCAPRGCPGTARLPARAP